MELLNDRVISEWSVAHEPQSSLELSLSYSLIEQISASFSFPDTTEWTDRDVAIQVEGLRTRVGELSTPSAPDVLYRSLISGLDALANCSAIDETYDVATSFVRSHLPDFQTFADRYEGEGMDVVLSMLDVISTVEEEMFFLENLHGAVRRASVPERLSDPIESRMLNVPSEREIIVKALLSSVYGEDEQASVNGLMLLGDILSLYQDPELAQRGLMDLRAQFPEGKNYFSDDLIHIWVNGTNDEEVRGDNQFLYQFGQLIRLLGVDPSIPTTLRSDFGIMRVGRYPPEVLIEQFGLADDREVPYGLILSTRIDHNGSYSFGAARELFQRMFSQAKKLGITLRFVEVGSEEEIEEMAYIFSQKYPPAEFGIIISHASEKRIILDGHAGNIASIDSDLHGFSPLESVIRSKGHVVFDSCEVGRPGSFAERFANAGFIAHGPAEKSFLKGIRLVRGDPLTVIPVYERPDHLRTYFPPTPQADI